MILHHKTSFGTTEHLPRSVARAAAARQRLAGWLDEHPDVAAVVLTSPAAVAWATGAVAAPVDRTAGVDLVWVVATRSSAALVTTEVEADRVAEEVGELGEGEELLLVRGRVDAAEERHPEGVEVLRDRLVRGQHELLDDPVGNVSRSARDACHLAEFIELDKRLRHIEIDGPAAHPLAVQNERKLAHQFEPQRHIHVARAKIGVALQNPVHVRVRHPVPATNHARRELLAHQIAPVIDLEQRAQDQPVHVRPREQCS